MKNNIAYGIHTVHNLVKSGEASQLVVLEKAKKNKKILDIISLAKSKSIEIDFCTEVNKFYKFVDKNCVHQNIIAFYSEKENKLYNDKDIPLLMDSIKDKNAFILVLDEVQDPHNMGACIRSGYSAGVDFIIIPKDKSAPINATVKKVASGAVEFSKIVVVTNLARVIEKLQKQGVWFTGLAGETDENIYSIDFTGDIGLVAGSEGRGMRKKTKDVCDYLAKIPMAGDEVSSLNISVATGIALYEVVRQRV